MAYKFQLGAATMSGSLTQEGQVIGESLVGGNSYEFSVGTDGVVDSSANISSSADLYGANLYLGSVQITATAAELNYLDGADSSINTLSLPDNTTITAFAASFLDDADEATFKATVNLEIGTDVQAYDAGLADIAGLAVTDGNIIVGDGSNWVAESGATARTSLGVAIGSDVQAWDAQLDDIAALAVTDGNIIVGDGSNWVAESGATARTSLGLGTGDSPQFTGLTLTGDLTVQGTTTTVDSTTINISSSFTFEGLADDYETTLNIIDPAADRTVSLPDASGVVAVFSVALSDAELATALTAAPSEINLLDAGAGSSLTLAAGDSLIIFDADDAENNSAQKVLMSDVKTFVETGFNPAVNVQNVAAAGTLISGINYFSDMGSDGEDAVTLPASPSVGQSVKVKAPSDCSAARYITINRAGSQTIDGEVSIRLESPFAAVELVYVASNLWRVF